MADTIIIPTQGHACLYYSFIGTLKGQTSVRIYDAIDTHPIENLCAALPVGDFFWENLIFLTKNIFPMHFPKFCSNHRMYVSYWRIDTSRIDKRDDMQIRLVGDIIL